MYGFSESEDLPSTYDENPCFKTVFQFTSVVVEFPLNLWICCNESDLFPSSKRLHWQIVGLLKVHSNLCLVAFGGSGRCALTDELLGRKRHRRPVRRSLISSCCYFGLRAPSYCTSHRWLALPPSSSPCSYIGLPPSSACASSGWVRLPEVGRPRDRRSPLALGLWRFRGATHNIFCRKISFGAIYALFGCTIFSHPLWWFVVSWLWLFMIMKLSFGNMKLLISI